MIVFSELIELKAINRDRPSRISSYFGKIRNLTARFVASQSNLKSIALIKFRCDPQSFIAIWPFRYYRQIDEILGGAEQANSRLERCHLKGESRKGNKPDRSHSFQDHQTLRGGLNNVSKTGLRGATSWLVKTHRPARSSSPWDAKAVQTQGRGETGN